MARSRSPRTGVVSRGQLRRRRQPARGNTLAMAGIAAAVLVAVALMSRDILAAPGPIASVTPGTATSAVADASPTATARPSQASSGPPTPAPTFPPTLPPTPPPTPTPSPTGTPIAPTPPPTPSPTPSPTPRPTATPRPTPSAAPTPAPAQGLVIVEPADQSVIDDWVIVVRGLAQPGAAITREIPLWFDEHTVADRLGRWAFVVALAQGRNEFTFRLGDDLSTRQTLTIIRRTP